MTEPRPRYTTRLLPPYSYVPGFAPHPVSDPRGHMYDETPATVPPLAPDDWRHSPEYLYGADLFNHGYYWEAHEAWESLWHAAGRAGRVASFLKGLIKLAAAGVKAREGNPRGVQRHAARSIELLTASQDEATRRGDLFCGADLAELIAIGNQMAGGATEFNEPQPELQLAAMVRLDQPQKE